MCVRFRVCASACACACMCAARCACTPAGRCCLQHSGGRIPFADAAACSCILSGMGTAACLSAWAECVQGLSTSCPWLLWAREMRGIKAAEEHKRSACHMPARAHHLHALQSSKDAVTHPVRGLVRMNERVYMRMHSYTHTCSSIRPRICTRAARVSKLEHPPAGFASAWGELPLGVARCESGFGFCLTGRTPKS